MKDTKAIVAIRVAVQAERERIQYAQQIATDAATRHNGTLTIYDRLNSHRIGALRCCLIDVTALAVDNNRGELYKSLVELATECVLWLERLDA